MVTLENNRSISPRHSFSPSTQSCLKQIRFKPIGNDAILQNLTCEFRISSFLVLDDYGSLSVHCPVSFTESVSCVLWPILVLVTAALLHSPSPPFANLHEGSCGVLVLPAL